MSFDKQQAEAKLRDILGRIRAVSASIQDNIIKFRAKDAIDDEADEYRTLGDIWYHLREDYRKIDRILTDLDKYQK